MGTVYLPLSLNTEPGLPPLPLRPLSVRHPYVRPSLSCLGLESPFLDHALDSPEAGWPYQLYKLSGGCRPLSGLLLAPACGVTLGFSPHLRSHYPGNPTTDLEAVYCLSGLTQRPRVLRTQCRSPSSSHILGGSPFSSIDTMVIINIVNLTEAGRPRA